MAGNVLLITGAGASRKLGQGKPMLLMNGWSRDLLDRMGEREPFLGEGLGLHADLDGEAFEQALGRFFAWHRSLVTAADLADLGEIDLGRQLPKVFPGWLQRANERAKAVTEVILESMHANFGASSISTWAAEQAYGKLIPLLGIDTGGRLTVATTNYDSTIPEALAQLKLWPDWGQSSPTMSGDQFLVKVDGLSAAIASGRTPVLFLHGRVGWYRNARGELISLGVENAYNPSMGLPGFLYPEPLKEYDKDPLFKLMWEEFRSSVAQANRILVVGHSLHDHGLVDALKGKVAATRVVGWTPDEGSWSAYEKDIQTRLPGVRCLRLEFGPEMSIDQPVAEFFRMWVDGQ